MSSPQHPTGSGAHPWHDPHAPNPGPNNDQPAAPGQGSAYGSGPVSGPQQWQSGPGQFGSAPGGPGPYAPGGPGPYAPGGPGPYGPGSQGASPYGSAPHNSGAYGSAPVAYGSGPGAYGSAPGAYGSGPGSYGSGPGSHGSGPQGFAHAQPPRRRRSGPGLLGPLTLRDLLLLFAGLLSLIVLFVPFKSFGLISVSLWSWNVDMMGTFLFNVLVIWLIVAAVLVNKFGTGSLRVGSLSLDQTISVLSGAAFAFAFLQLVTSAPYWHVGAYLAFFAALIAFFAGVLTMLPFFATEFANRDEIPAHPKARPVSKHAASPAPRAPLPGAAAGGGFGPPAPGAAFGSQQGGPAGQFGGPDSQPGGHPGGTGNQAGGHSGGRDSHQVGSAGQPGGSQQQYGQPDQRMHDSFAPHDSEGTHSPDGSASTPQVHSTGGGQTYLGAHDADAPQHSQSEPTQTLGFGARSGDEPVAAETDSTTASERRRGRHAAPGGEAGSVNPDATGNPDATAAGATASAAAPTAGASVMDETLVDTPAVGAAAGESRFSAPNSDSDVNRDSGQNRGSDDSRDSGQDRESKEGSGEGSSTQSQAADSRSERTTPPESDEPTQYVPMGSYGSDSDSNSVEPGNSQTSEQETVVQPAVPRDPRSDDNRSNTSGDGSRNAAARTGDPESRTGGPESRTDDPESRSESSRRGGNGGQQIIQAFWFAVPEPREAVDATTGMPVFTIYPGDWFLGLEDHGSWFKVRDSDGREGLLRNTEGIQRG
ncbi:hypothetical protein [Brevibacterium sp.]|uniref:hypothetical protein n=1 Tax=Brevibacterium sp. TaxID=1701 RepID=UPI002810EAC2|nr:hypothetical protein [Brevibacterium sp.]